MGFNWIYLNPFQYPGFSGSLYAIKDYFRFHPLLRGSLGLDPFLLLQNFLAEAKKLGMAVMMDLVVNHTASDSPLTVQHPVWFARNSDGGIKHPSAIDPADTRKVTIWGDLAELEYWPLPDPEGVLAFFNQVVDRYLSLGFSGFRGDAAYKVPGEFWGHLIKAARRINPEVCFVAETLGCRLPEVMQLQEAGFDFLYNSSKWWDFQEDWCLEQYEEFRRIAPSLSFPETHDTPRLIVEAKGSLPRVRQRYLFAAFFSSGLLMPMGFEYGLKKKLHVVNSRPEDWEERTYDWCDFITRVNQLKKSCPILQEEGPIERLTPAGQPVVILRKSSEHHPGAVVAVINTTAQPQPQVPLEGPSLLGLRDRCDDLTPDASPWAWGDLDTISLTPWDLRLFYAHP